MAFKYLSFNSSIAVVIRHSSDNHLAFIVYKKNRGLWGMNPDFAAHLLTIFYKMEILKILSAEMEEVGGE